MFEFKDAELEENAYISIDGAKYYLTPAKYKNGTNLTAEVLNKFVFEKGQNENGYYIKFKNGMAICFNSETFSNVPGGNALGNLYRSNSVALKNFPIQFSVPPTVVYSLQKTTEIGWIGTLNGNEYQVTNSRPGNPIIIKATNNNIESVTIGYVAFGQY